MSKKTRWILFFIAAAAFIVISYAVVVFALGYKYDFAERKFVRMGSFRVIANTSADVYLNGKLAGDTSFISNEFSKGRLLSRTYTVRLQKDGYHKWEKKVPVIAGLFTDFPKIVLLPEKFETEKVATESFGFPMEDSNIRVTKDKSLAFDAHTISIEWLDNTDYQPFHNVGDFETPIGFPGGIDDVQWYRDREHLLVSSGGFLWFTEIDHRGGLNTWQLTPLSGPFLYDEGDNAVYKLENKQLLRFKL